jgi:aspartate kinase
MVAAMGLVVQKFGGTSVADCEKILAAARKAVRAQQDGNHVVVVVSAMGHNTDHLIELAHKINEQPPAREMDMLLSTGEQVSVALMAMAIDTLGFRAVSLTGAQLGIRTDSSHTKARIKSISTDRIKQLLEEGNIVIAAGFQGIDEYLNITTLGRGGSDTTAVALAAVLEAEACEIYTDVDGVYTTDPRILPEARLTRQVSYDEMLELASLGAGVMHSRSIEFGKKFGVPIHVRNSQADVAGSLIVNDPEAKGEAVSGAALTRDEARISLTGLPDVPGVCHQLFAPLDEKKITVDMIVQSPSADGRADVSFTVPRDELKLTLRVIQPVVQSLGGVISDCSENVSKVSVVGLGMAHQVGVATRMFQALARADINLQMITTSEIKISVLVDRAQALKALRAVHEEFGLHRTPENAVVDPFAEIGKIRRQASPVDVIQRLRGVELEGLTVDNIGLDETQASMTLLHLPNDPGVAAEVFAKLAGQGVFVDMIVQTWNSVECSDLTFTIPREQMDSARAVARQLGEKFTGSRIREMPAIAKLSVSGIGLRSHTGMATGIFQALRDANINLEIINTSEVRINVAVDAKDGAVALARLNERFVAAMK